MSRQHTVGAAFSLSGIGIHSGKSSRVTVHPAEPGTGRLLRVGSATVPARADFVVDTSRCTVLGSGDARVSTVEHLLSALFACGIDNAVIEVFGPEIPILDGSALPFLDAIDSAGIVEQATDASVLTLDRDLDVVSGAATLKALPASTLTVEVNTLFDDWPDGTAAISWKAGPHAVAEYRSTVAPARTFAFRQEVEALLRAGLAKGGSLDNVLIVSPPDGFSSPLRVRAEWCAHKLLDVLGDLALAGGQLEMTIHALRPGHRANTRLAAELLKLRLAQVAGR